MAGEFAVLRDVPKTLAYELEEYKNQAAGREVILQSVIDEVSLAELCLGQKDTDSLPPY